MPGLREADYIAWRISRAREHEAKSIAAAVDVPLGRVRAWRRGTTHLPDSTIVAIVEALDLDAEVLEQHRQRRRQRHAETAHVCDLCREHRASMQTSLGHICRDCEVEMATARVAGSPEAA